MIQGDRMLDRLFPSSLTNDYRGSWVAIWLLAPVLIVKTLMGFNFSGFNPVVSAREILETVDGVPVGTFETNAAAAVIEASSAWGVALLALCLFAWLVLIRYRSALPIAILILLFEQVGRTGADTVRVIGALLSGAAELRLAVTINLAMTTLLAVALVLSLLRMRSPRSPA